MVIFNSYVSLPDGNPQKKSEMTHFAASHAGWRGRSRLCSRGARQWWFCFGDFHPRILAGLWLWFINGTQIKQLDIISCLIYGDIGDRWTLIMSWLQMVIHIGWFMDLWWFMDIYLYKTKWTKWWFKEDVHGIYFTNTRSNWIHKTGDATYFS